MNIEEDDSSKKAQILPEDKQLIEELIGESTDNLPMESIWDKFNEVFNAKFDKLEETKENLELESKYLDVQERLINIIYPKQLEIPNFFSEMNPDEMNSIKEQSMNLIKVVLKTNKKLEDEKKERLQQIDNMYAKRETYKALYENPFFHNISTLKSILDLNLKILDIFPSTQFYVLKGKNPEHNKTGRDIDISKYDFEYQTEIEIEKLDENNLPIKIDQSNITYYKYHENLLKENIDAYKMIKDQSVQIQILNQTINLIMHQILDENNGFLRDIDALKIAIKLFLLLYKFIVTGKISSDIASNLIHHYTNIWLDFANKDTIIKRANELDELDKLKPNQKKFIFNFILNKYNESYPDLKEILTKPLDSPG